jgi:hypothetical protein
MITLTTIRSIYGLTEGTKPWNAKEFTLSAECQHIDGKYIWLLRDSAIVSIFRYLGFFSRDKGGAPQQEQILGTGKSLRNLA